MFGSLNYGNPFQGFAGARPGDNKYRYSKQISDRFKGPKAESRSRSRFNEGKSKQRDSVYDRRLEDLQPADYYYTMLQYEKSSPTSRVYNEKIMYLEEVVPVFKFYFKECYQKLEQRKQTCHLAMAYYTQTIMR